MYGFLRRNAFDFSSLGALIRFWRRMRSCGNVGPGAIGLGAIAQFLVKSPSPMNTQGCSVRSLVW
jgi:hypothetical protein